MKRLFLCFIAIYIIVIHVKAWGTVDFTYGNLGYDIVSVEDRLVQVVDAIDDGKGVYVIPREVEYNNIKFAVESIGYLAFMGGHIKSVTIPSNISRIIDCGFYSSTKSIETLVIEDSPEILDCSWLHGVNDYDGGQFSRTIVKDLYIGRDVDYVPWSQYYRDYSPFYGVNTIEKIEIGKYVKDVSYIPLEYNGNLTDIILHATEPPVAPKFSNLQYINVSVTIPRGTLDKYKSTSWGTFIKLKESEENVSKIALDYDKELGSVYVNRQLVDHEVTIDNGSDVELLLIPAMGKVISGLYINNENKLAELTNNTILLNNVTDNTSIKIVFSEPMRNVRMTCGDGGTYCISVENGSFLDILIEENDGWKLKSVLVNNVENINDLSDYHLYLNNISTDYTISAIYEETSSMINNISDNLDNSDIYLNGKDIIFLNASNVTKKIYDTSGKLIYKGTNNQYTILDSGVYIVELNKKKYKIAM